MEGGGDLDLVGVLFALAAGVFWGLYILLGAALGRHTTEGNGLALGMVIAALIAVPFGVADAGTALLEPWVLAAGLGVALLSSVIPYTLDLEALRRMPARVFGILMSLEPAMAALIGLILLSESLHWSQWIAVLCVVIASAGATRSAAPSRDEVGALCNTAMRVHDVRRPQRDQLTDRADLAAPGAGRGRRAGRPSEPATRGSGPPPRRVPRHGRESTG